jgi:hypothetical protein
VTIHPVGAIARAATAALCGIAAIAALAGAVPGSAAASSSPQRHSGADAPAIQTAGSLPVVINCAGHGQTRPGRYILACGDANAYLSGLHWAAWQPTDAFAAGTDTFRVCIPTCVAGRLHSFPVLATLWRVQSLPGHRSVRYFTRLTIIYTGRRSYSAGGKTFHLPQTATYPLSASGGAGN